MTVREIKGTIILGDGSESEFSITAGLGTGGNWQQWGATTERLGETVEVLEAMDVAVAEFMGDEED